MLLLQSKESFLGATGGRVLRARRLRPPKKGYASRMEGYACVCARIRHPCRMGAYAPVRGEGARTGPSWSEFASKDWKPAQISNHASIMRPMRMRPTRIRHPQRMAEIRMALLSPFATRCSKKAKSWRNAHKTGAAGATAQLGLPGLLRGRKWVHNRVVKALVCTFSPANTLATPVSLRLTADAIMQDLAPVAPNWLLTPWLVVGCC